jgi:hypothetical protein
MVMGNLKGLDDKGSEPYINELHAWVEAETSPGTKVLFDPTWSIVFPLPDSAGDRKSPKYTVPHSLLFEDWTKLEFSPADSNSIAIPSEPSLGEAINLIGEISR